ncbi:hypothetical protein L2E82_17488 [Cichorium intybus]|uniref:Uncharacterized protein n=1 Tax=Cichorium intybus TaxID=13427 RepID=A0ACB9F985_CICIN|nr:hypothetical protein L2E82_17488 [Cichorium intybus]
MKEPQDETGFRALTNPLMASRCPLRRAASLYNFVDFLSLLAKGEKDNEDHNLWFLLLLVRFHPSLLLLYSNPFGHTHRFEFRPTEDDHDDAPDDGISLSSSTLCFSSAFSCSYISLISVDSVPSWNSFSH